MVRTTREDQSRAHSSYIFHAGCAIGSLECGVNDGCREGKALTLPVLSMRIVHHVVLGTWPGLRAKPVLLIGFGEALDVDVGLGLLSPRTVVG